MNAVTNLPRKQLQLLFPKQPIERLVTLRNPPFYIERVVNFFLHTYAYRRSSDEINLSLNALSITDMILTTEEFANICCYPEEYAGLLSEETEPADPDVFNALCELMGSELAMKMNMLKMLRPDIKQTHSEFCWREWKNIYNRIFGGKSPSELIDFTTRNFPQVKCREDLLQYLPKIPT